MRKTKNIVLLLAVDFAIVSGDGFGKLRGYFKSHMVESSIVKYRGKVLENPVPLGRCQEGCFKDNDCDESLKCFQYSVEGPVPPGCNGELLEGNKKYCYDPADEIALTPRKLQSGLTIGGGYRVTIVGYNGSPNSSYPLKRCQGDCDTDEDCEGALECKFRSGLPELAVPGCYGIGLPGADYCHNPGDPLLWDPWPPEAFRLRLYWDERSNWQGISDEQWWCMECWNGCDIGDMMFMKWCDTENTRFVFVKGTIPGRVQIQVGGTNLCLENMNGNEVQVQVCNSAKTSQWFESQMGSFDSDKFDIRPMERTSRCFTQQHHPKENERVYTEKCGVAHVHKTGYWNKFFI